MKYLIQSMSTHKEKIAAVLNLIYRIRVTKFTFLLLCTIQGKAQTCRINPTLTDLNQSPYKARGSHGICDFGQACCVANLRKAVTFFGERNILFSCLDATYSCPFNMDFTDSSSPWPHINMQVLQKDGTGDLV